MKIKLEPDEIAAIREALENPNYNWRTIQGVSKDTGIALERVGAYLLGDPDGVARSSALSKDGESLFTTMEHFQKRTSSVNKISSAFKNRLS